MNRAASSRRELLIAAGLCVLFGGRAAAVPSVPSVPRRLKLKNVHTGETFEGLYRDAAGPIPAALADLAVLLRDHHVNKIGPVHVETLDFLADVMEAVGVAQATILSAFRTPETNAKLATIYFGVAEESAPSGSRARRDLRHTAPGRESGRAQDGPRWCRLVSTLAFHPSRYRAAA